MTECPECDTRLGATGGCRKCGWMPTPEKRDNVLPMYREVPDRSQQIREPMTEEIKAMLGRLKASFEVVAPAVRAKAVETFKRCPECANGKFVHLGVRFCGACYRRL